MSREMPYLRFYPKEYLGDIKLRLCSVAERGLWLDLICLMHESPRRGYLIANGKQITKQNVGKTLAKLCGENEDEMTRLVEGLLDKGVLLTTDDGTIYNHRMVGEGNLSEIRAKAGRQGGRPRKQKQNVSKTKASENQNESKPSREAQSFKAQSFKDSKDSKDSKKLTRPILSDEKSPDVRVQSMPGDYSDKFQEAWEAYPARPHNPKKAAWKAWKARVREGVTEGALLTATRNYAEWIRREGTEPRFVKMAATFYGPGGHVDEFVSGVPPEPIPLLSEVGRRTYYTLEAWAKQKDLEEEAANAKQAEISGVDERDE